MIWITCIISLPAIETTEELSKEKKRNIAYLAQTEVWNCDSWVRDILSNPPNA